jgi:hypothetical protein
VRGVISEPCQFCKQPAVARCEWGVEGLRAVTYADIKPGDRIRRVTDSCHRRKPAVVAEVSNINDQGEEMLTTLRLVLQLSTGLRVVYHSRFARVMAVREVPCLAPVCENHLRCVEPGCEYCADHWHAWEAVA